MTVSQTELPGQVWLVTVSGRLDQAFTPELEAQFNLLLADGHYLLVVDMSKVVYINSGGLRCLVSTWRKVHKNSGKMIFFGLNQRVFEIFSMVGFDKVFQIFPTSEAALAAIQQQASEEKAS